MGELGPWKYEEGLDSWVSSHLHPSLRSCSFCGGIDPEQVLEELAARRARIGTTTKAYKIYLMPWHAKVYFQHFSVEQRKAFVDLFNERKNDGLFNSYEIGDETITDYFNPLPFFMAYV